LIYLPDTASGATELPLNYQVEGVEVWNPLGSPYIVDGNLYVKPGASLTIAADTVVKFRDGASFYASGDLLIQGTIGHEVIFTSDNPNPAPGIWQGISMSSANTKQIDNLTIRYADHGIDGVETWMGSVHFSNIKMENCNYGIYFKIGGGANFNHVIISNCDQSGIYLNDFSDCIFNDVTFLNCEKYGIYLESVSGCQFNGITADGIGDYVVKVANNVQGNFFRDFDVNNSFGGIRITDNSCTGNVIDGGNIRNSQEAGLYIDVDTETTIRNLAMEHNFMNFYMGIEGFFNLNIPDSNTVNGKNLRLYQDTNRPLIDGALENLGMVIIVNSSNFELANMNLDGNGSPALLIKNSNNIEVRDSSFSNYTRGLLTLDSSNLIIRNNIFHHVWVDNYFTISVGFEEGQNIVVDNNRVEHGPVRAPQNNNGIGIYLIQCSGTQCIGNEISGTLMGIIQESYLYSENNVFIENTITNSNFGMGLLGGSVSSIMNNTITGIDIGMLLDEMNRSKVNNNIIMDASDSCIMANTINDTEFINNIFSSAKTGLNITDEMFGESRSGGFGFLSSRFEDLEFGNNTIYYNVFEQLDTPILRPFNKTKNTWNNTEEGNFWSDYTGQDTNGDGTGDTMLPHQEVDYLPLMERLVWRPEVPVIHPLPSLTAESIFRVNWTPSLRLGNYRLYYSWEPDFNNSIELSLEDNETDVEILEEGIVYFKVEALNQYGSRGISDKVETNVQFPPAMPENLTAVPLEEGKALNVSWDVINETHLKFYELFYTESSEDENPVESWTRLEFSPEIGWVVLLDLTNDVNYTFTIRSMDDFDLVSPFSEFLKAKPIDILAPAAPDALVLGYVDAYLVSFNVPSTSDGDIREYRLYRSTGSRAVEMVSSESADADTINDTDPQEGESQYALVAVDTSNNTSPYSPWFNITVPSKNKAPVVNISLKEIVLIEDIVYTKFNMSSLFTDPDGNPLFYSHDPVENMTIEIDGVTGNVTFTPADDFHGVINVTFYANDTQVEVNTTIMLRVLSVNDRPVIENVMASGGPQGIVWGSNINLEVVATDVDLPENTSLDVVWSIEGGLPIGTGSKIVFDSSKLVPGTYKILVNVSDEKGLWAASLVHLKIVHLFQTEDDGQPLEFQAGKKNDFNLTFSFQGNITGNITAEILPNSTLSDYITIEKIYIDSESKKVTVKGFADLPEDITPSLYNITVTIDVGDNEAIRHTFEVKVNEADSGGGKTGGDSEGKADWFWFLLIGFLILLIVVIVLVVMLKKKGEQDQDPAELLAEDTSEPDYETEEAFVEDADMIPEAPIDEEYNEIEPEEPPLEETPEEVLEPEADIPEEEVPEEKPKAPAGIAIKAGAPAKKESIAEQEPEITFADSSFTCRICFGVVKTGLPIIKCRCGKKYHQTCAERVGECPGCEFDYSNWDAEAAEERAMAGEEKKDEESVDESEAAPGDETSTPEMATADAGSEEGDEFDNMFKIDI